MPKLIEKEKFIDVSDYGRKPAIFLADKIKNTSISPIHITYLFGICGAIAIFCMLNHFYLLAAIFLILKSVIDAMDGELARIKDTPSYTGRYLDSIFDSILNFLFLSAIAFVSNTPILLGIIAYICMQLQGTLYNYYYVILRHRSEGGDNTSKIFEMKAPGALPGENQTTVNVLFFIFTILYAPFDKTIYVMDNDAYKAKTFPNWFMTFVSFYGLGFQLLIMGLMLVCGWVDFIIPFFIGYTLLLPFLIIIRKLLPQNIFSV